MRPLDRKLRRDLWRVKGQVIAIMLVMGCGIAIVVMTFGVMLSLQRTRHAYYETYRFAHVFSQLERAPDSVATQIAQWPGVAAVETRITHYAPVEIPGVSRPAAVLLVSLPERGQPRLNRIVLRQGRLPLRGRDEAVISENMAKATGIQPGQQLTIRLRGRQRLVRIVGVALSPEFIYVLGPGQFVSDDATFGVMWMSRDVLEAPYRLDGAFNDVSVLLAPGASEADIIARLDRLLAPYGGTAAYSRADQTSDAFVTQELAQLRTMAFAIPPIFLGVAAFLIHMVMSRLIDTERETIGLLKSFGYTRWEIGSHYAKFAVAIAMAGIFVGLVAGGLLGQWMTAMYQNYFRFPFLTYRLDRTVVATVVLISFGATLAGTGMSVARAMRLAPATAMQPPSPPIYRHSVFDRLPWARRVSAPTQMIFRHIERWPLRASLTSLGIAMAVALLIGLLFSFDALDEMVDRFYFRANHQDAVVGLVEQRSDAARFEISRFPGVRAVGPVFDVPARLTHGHLSQRTAISGLSPSDSFHTFQDAEGRPFTLPRHGIVLSDKLARLLQVHAGDPILVEILEGQRRSTRVPIAAITSEHVGLSAYMDRQALESMTGLGSGVTALRLMLDAAEKDKLMRQLKQVPSVGSISTRAESVASLRETMARSMMIVIDFYIALGTVITFGVTYNFARISLSERSRELASLRVLGFTRGEVAYLLLGEMALLLVAALPAGCLGGYGLAAFLSAAMETKLFRVPFIVAPRTFGIAMTIVLSAAILSALVVARRVHELDLVAVLKARE